jgi:hypothetical protein
VTPTVLKHYRAGGQAPNLKWNSTKDILSNTYSEFVDISREFC